MNIVQKFLLSVVNFLIAVGDAVIFVATSPARLVKSAQSSVKNHKPKAKNLKGEFKLPKKKAPKKVRQPIKIPIIPALRFVQNTILGLLRLIKKMILFVFHIVVRILSIPFIPIRWYLRHRARVAERKMAEARRMARLKNNGYRPSILYKLKFVLIGFLLSTLFIFIPLASAIFVSDLPNLSDLSVNNIPKTTKIYDRNGTLLYEIYANQNRTVVHLSDIPLNLRHATVAIEDKDFYSHPGFDIRGMARALLTNVRKQGFQGGSTITQQLVKSAFLSPDPTVVRKIKEIALAFWAERVYSKDQILELYLNYVPYGGSAWGAQAASNIYFGKNVGDLDLAQSAFLAGLPQSPSVYSPFFGNGNLWKGRQREVLNSMRVQGYITAQQEKDALAEQLTFQSPQVPLKAPHFVMYVRNLLIQKYGISEVERGGLTVRTSLDLPTQDQAEQIVSNEIDADANLNIGNGAALITNPSNGDILAMVGSRNYYDADNDGEVNLTTSLRQPGSSIKLVTYSLALSNGYTEASILDDTPLTIPGVDGGPSYSPVNYDGTFHGQIPLRTAFANSFNIPPVRLTQKFGAQAVHDWGLKMGISSWQGLQNYGVSITLGAADVTMTDMATAYGVMANAGNRVDLDPLLEVQDSYGKTIYKKNVVPNPIIDPGVTYIISDILADPNARRIEFGLDTPLNIPGSKVSVKTGTTDNKRDNWTIGYTPNVLVATWVGNNDNSPMNPALASGITGAAPMWNKLMTMEIQKTGTPSALIAPEDIVQKYCIGMNRYFIKGTENSVNCAGPAPITPSPTPVH